ncbi:cyclopropane-fatty-acyl-phospholipid synthase family protein [Allokutzneria multivorans]|uniref:cyclopropane-fatty-acyl-phospholipid synthase family protein n=1 Tax=Allokutzneria multivorans TaxID=1142134 RepID=UPI0031ED03FC
MSQQHGVAQTLAELVERVLGAGLPVGLRAWDGSTAGPSEGPVAVVRNRRALRRLLWDPNELGLARAYVSGDLDVEGDLAEGLRRFWALARKQRPRVSAADRVELVKAAVRLGVIGPRPKAPPEEARLRGRLHTRLRDRAAIAHHYDLSNEFYEKVLDPHMAYSSGYWTSDDPGYTLTDAQRDKLDLVCRKLELKPGMHLLDVGCGWGSMILHAAEHYGVHATGITLSAQQRDFIENRIKERDLTDKVTVRLQDYRELSDGPYDAVSSIEMGEHVGAGNYPIYTSALHRAVKPGGRVLIQQMSRGKVAPGGGAFIEGYVAPDMTMSPVGSTVNLIERAGFEVRGVEAMREHYVRTVDVWAETIEKRWAELVRLVGEGQARVWRLYMAGGSLAFAENRMGVNQILATRPAVI